MLLSSSASIIRILIVALLLSQNGCNNSSLSGKTTPQITEISTTSAWANALLSHSTCIAPCWEGITPGKTTMQEAVNILKARSDVTNLVGPEKIPHTEMVSISWQFEEDRSSAAISSDDSGSYVKLINFDPNKNKIRLKEFATSFGPPDYIYIFPTEINHICGIQINFLDYGLAMQYSTNTKTNDVNIAPDDVISSIALLSKDEMKAQLNGFPVDARQNLYPWNGYGKYPICKK